MKRAAWLIAGAALCAWLASSVYIVAGDQRAVVLRCGKLVSDNGRPVVKQSGLHFDWPWPFSRVRQVNVHEVRNLTIHPAAERSVSSDRLLDVLNDDHSTTYLTGDKNILHLEISVQYHVDETAISDFLFHHRDGEARLTRLLDRVTSDVLAECGVDYVHPLGLAELRVKLTQRMRVEAEKQRMGIAIDEVAVNDVAPPIAVKAAFLDVVNARTEKQNTIAVARAYAEQATTDAAANARAIVDAARGERERIVEAARGRAARFTQLVQELRSAESGNRKDNRRFAMERYYWESMKKILSNVKAKVLLEGDDPADVSVFPKSSGLP